MTVRQQQLYLSANACNYLNKLAKTDGKSMSKYMDALIIETWKNRKKDAVTLENISNHLEKISKVIGT
jgi:dihydrodipicolinate reductase